MAFNPVRRTSAFAPLSATYYEDDCIAMAGEAAEVLFTRGLAFCARTMNDGFISDLQLVRQVGVGMADAVQRAELLCMTKDPRTGQTVWERVDGGYLVRSWLAWNRSKAEIEKYRETDRKRKAKGGQLSFDEPPPDPPNGETEPSERNPHGVRPEPSHASAGFLPPDTDTDTDTETDTEAETDARASLATRARGAPQLRVVGGEPLPAVVTARDVVAAWCDAVKVNGVVASRSQCGQVGKIAKELLEGGNDPDRVLEAARQAGGKGYPSIDRELTVLAAPPPRPRYRHPTVDDKIAELQRMSMRPAALPLPK